MRKKLIAAAALLLCATAVSAQDKRTDFAATVTQADLRKHLEVLASDKYEGRETGEVGQKLAAKYISYHFEQLGLKAPIEGAENPYLQPVPLEKSGWGEVSITTGGQKMVFLKDFMLYGGGEADNEEVEVVFAGYGLDGDKFSDYKGVDVKGKAVVILSGEPKGKDGKYIISGGDKPAASSLNIRNKFRTAYEKGAVLVIAASESDAEFQKTVKMYSAYFSRPSLSLAAEDTEDKPKRLPSVMTSPSAAAKILGTDSKKFMKALKKADKKGKSAAGQFSGKINITAKRNTEMIGSENVLGFLEGTDKKDEILVITAHYDHIGIDKNTKAGEDSINNGADDDGSGTVSVLELAEAFVKAKEAGNGPRRSILFMLFTGEEKGLLGSEYYSNNPVYPMANTITNLNIDMVGRVDEAHKDNPNYVYLIGSDMLSSELHNLNEETAKKYASDVALDYTYNAKDDPNRFYYRSDHYNFAKHGVPVIFYFNGTHEDYHKPSDEVEKIHFGKMERIGRLVFVTAWELANRDERVKVDKAESAKEDK